MMEYGKQSSAEKNANRKDTCGPSRREVTAKPVRENGHKMIETGEAEEGKIIAAKIKSLQTQYLKRETSEDKKE